MKKLIYAVMIVALATTSAYAQKKTIDQQNYEDYRKALDEKLREEAICKEKKIETEFLVTKDSLSFFITKGENPQLWVKNQRKESLRTVFNDGQVIIIGEVKSGEFSPVCPYKGEGKQEILFQKNSIFVSYTNE